MADDDDLANARKVLVDMRNNWVKTIAAGFKRGDTENAIKAIVEVQQAINVIDRAIEEQELPEDDEFDDE